MSVISERFLFRGAGFRAGARLRHPVDCRHSVSIFYCCKSSNSAPVSLHRKCYRASSLTKLEWQKKRKEGVGGGGSFSPLPSPVLPFFFAFVLTFARKIWLRRLFLWAAAMGTRTNKETSTRDLSVITVLQGKRKRF